MISELERRVRDTAKLAEERYVQGLERLDTSLKVGPNTRRNYRAGMERHLRALWGPTPHDN